jgi:hypothetical protein
VNPVSASRTVRLELEARQAGQFNGLVLAALEDFGTEQRFGINFDEVAGMPRNFFRGDRQYEDLIAHEEPDFPALTMWMGDGADLAMQKTRRFSGQIAVYWRFWFFVLGLEKDGLVEQREAAEAALIAMLYQEFTSCGYRGDLNWSLPQDRKLYAADEVFYGWVQEVLFTATFGVQI